MSWPSAILIPEQRTLFPWSPLADQTPSTIGQWWPSELASELASAASYADTMSITSVTDSLALSSSDAGEFVPSTPRELSEDEPLAQEVLAALNGTPSE